MASLTEFHAWITALAQTYSEHQQELGDLDAAIGDGDHGINMARGFNKAKAALDGSDGNRDIASLLKAVSMQLIAHVGGASGPLYGTFFLKASIQAGANIQAGAKTELNAAEFFGALKAGVKGVQTLGKAGEGDKTMLDLWLPTLAALEPLAKEANMLHQALEVAEQQLPKIQKLMARKGRAAYLGQRSIGHQDPGAMSSYLMLQVAAQNLHF